MRLGYGTASAKQVTLSFWVKVSEAGTYCTGLRQPGILHSIHKELTLPANTWTRVEETFDGLTLDLSGLNIAYKTTNSGLIIDLLVLGGQTSKTSSTVGSWEVGNYVATPNQTDWMATAGNTVYITGVQLEVGDTATDFEHKPFGVELLECERYYEKSYSYSVAVGTNTTSGAQQGLNGQDGNQINGIRWITTKRATPAVTIYAKDGTVASLTDTNGNLGPNSGSWSALDSNEHGFRCVVGTGGLTAARAYYYHYTAVAEL